MGIPTEMSLFAFTRPTSLVGGTEIQFSGERLFCWPYKWDDGIKKQQQLVDLIAEEALKFLNARLAGKWKGDPLLLLKDTAWMATYCCASSWREIALGDEEAFPKLVLCTAYFGLIYILDDIVEGLAGDPGHAAVAKNFGRLLYKMFLFEFESTESLRLEARFQSLVANAPNMQDYIFSMLDITLEMMERFKVTASQSLYLARGVRHFFELQTWFGSKDMSHFYNPALRHELRTYSIGFDVVVEFWMVLDGIVISPKVRENFYWKRQYEAARTTGYLLNDIFSAKKEFEEKAETGNPMDNAVLICMDVEKVSFEEALPRVIQQHNKKLLEFVKDMKCMNADSDLLFDLNEQEKAVFFQSLECLGITLSHLVQLHILMGRYKIDDVTYTFEPYTLNDSS